MTYEHDEDHKLQNKVSDFKQTVSHPTPSMVDCLYVLLCGAICMVSMLCSLEGFEIVALFIYQILKTRLP